MGALALGRWERGLRAIENYKQADILIHVVLFLII
jgi:hypothetical protein